MPIEDAYLSWAGLAPDERELVLECVDLSMAVCLQNAGSCLKHITVRVDKMLLTRPVPYRQVNTLLKKHLSADADDRGEILAEILDQIDPLPTTPARI